MRILMASSEMAPLARTGGLGDVLGTLPAELQALGHEVSVVLPYYRSIRENRSLKIKNTGTQLSLQVGGKRLVAEVLQYRTSAGVQVFLVKRDEYFDRTGIYGAEGRAYEDNAERFIYFSKAVVELARRLTPSPDILHVHDWQTALVPVFVNDQELPFKTVLTLHNTAHQGSFWGLDFGLTNLPGEYFSANGVEFYGNLNFLKGGIVFADALTTVSERYAADIQTQEYGCGLEIVIREHSGKLTGILNGADYSIWNPATDKLLPRKYTPSSLAGKKNCRDALLQGFGLEKNPRGPVIAMVTRLAEQKGIDIVLPLLDRLLSDDVRLVILGEGESSYERDLMIAVKKHHSKFGFKRGFDDRLAHLIEAGADVTLIPSHYEPCSLSAMYSLKYGAIPIARACGGLHQIIQDFDPSNLSGNGFLFYDYSPDALWDGISRAKKLFTNKESWKSLLQGAMECNFSWKNAALEYEKVYRQLNV
ncbi:MAG: glycogen synthase GlgA [Verrucomicrobiota bacterium]